MANSTKIVVEQADENGIMSRTTVEHFGMDNGTANSVNTGITAAVRDYFTKLAADKADKTGEVFVKPQGFLWAD
jgi:hypothetical protein